jgi:putative phage-type endonuclease
VSSLISAKEAIFTLGGSGIAGALGISPFRSRWQVYALACGLIEPDPPTEAMEWGVRLQREIAQGFSAITKIPHEWFDKRIYHPERTWQHATPDAFSPTVANPKAVVEIKNVGLHMAGDWGKTYGEMGDEDGVPDYVIVQLQWQMDVTGTREAFVGTLVGGSDFRFYRVPYDAELAEYAVEEGFEFWRNVMNRIDPPIDASEEARGYLARRFPRDRDKLRPAAAGELDLLAEYADVRLALGPLETRKGELESELKLAIADAEGIEAPFARFTWKLRKGRQATDWQKLAEAQLVGYSDDERRALIAEHTSVGDGVRVIRFTDKRREAE